MPKSFSEKFAQIPPQTVTKVNGTTTEDGFLYIGRCITDEIESAVGTLAGRKLAILDFGCGLGRVLNEVERRAPEADLVGFDIDPMMLHWCGVLMEGTRAKLVHSLLDMADASFDLAIAVSVFTHLDRTTPFWLGELARLLKPEGQAFVTYQDETLFREMVSRGEIPGVAQGVELSGRHIVSAGTPEGGAAMGTFYRTAEWERTIAPYFSVVKTVPRGLFGHQSYSLLQSRAVNPGVDQRLRLYAAEIEQQLFALRKERQLCF